MDPRPESKAPAYKGADKLAGKAALITGGDSGIGRAVAVLYAREGADVAVAYLPAEQSDADETKRLVEAEGRRCVLLPGDVTDPAYCRDAVKQTVAAFGKVDVLVNNAGFLDPEASFEEITDDQIDAAFRANVFGYFYVTRAALPHIPDGGAIINTGSIAGLKGDKPFITYSATKGAIHAFTKALAQYVVGRHIRVNCVAPGPVWTPMAVDAAGGDPDAPNDGDPLGRSAQPEEVAPAYVFFASAADTGYVTGEVFAQLGGDVRSI